MAIRKLAIWVHPSWSRRDLPETAEFWRKNIERFAQDKELGFIMTGHPNDEFMSKAWEKRIAPIVRVLPELFEGRYIRWPGNFIYPREKPEHVAIIRNTFGTDKINEVFVDGLMPGPNYCVGIQYRQMQWMVKSMNDVYYWPEIN